MLRLALIIKTCICSPSRKFTPFHQVSLVRFYVESVRVQFSSVVVASSPSTSNISSYSSPSVDTKFPHTSLTPVTTNLPLSYASLFVISKELNANSISVHSNRGNGKLIHLSFAITNTVYRVKSVNDTFDITTHPGTQATHADGATSFKITEANRQHDAQLKDLNVYNQIDNILKQLLLVAIPDTYTDAIKDDDTGYGSVTTLTILTHLLDIYGETSDREIEDNITIM